MNCKNPCGNEAFVTVRGVGYCKPCYMELRCASVEKIKISCNEKEVENWGKLKNKGKK